MTILRLADHPVRSAETAALMEDIWPSHYGPGGDGNALADVLSRIADDRAAVALHNDAVVGTVALSHESFGSEGEGPWLVGLCTAPTVRGQGIATALTTWAMGNARQQGHPTLYTTTMEACGIMQRLGWTRIRTVPEGGARWSVWQVGLAEDGAFGQSVD